MNSAIKLFFLSLSSLGCVHTISKGAVWFDTISYRIDVEVKNMPANGSLVLCKGNGRRLDTLSIAKVLEGKVTFIGRLPESELLFIFTEDRKRGHVPIYVDGGRSCVTCDFLFWPQAHKTGSAASRQYDSIQRVTDGFAMQQKVFKDSLTRLGSQDSHLRAKLRQAMDSARTQYEVVTVPQLIEQNLNAGFIPFIIQNAPRLTLPQKVALFDRLPDSVRNGRYGRDLKDFLTREAIISEARAANRAPNLPIQLPGDHSVDSLSVLAGQSKLLLLDFWASWCVPCRAQFPDLLRIYRKYKHLGFEIVGLSIDEDTAHMTQAVREANLPWQQIPVGIHTGSPAIALYEVASIPRTLLIDDKMNIIGRDLHSSALDSIVRIYLNNSQ